MSNDILPKSISAVMTAHNEGAMAGVSFNNMTQCCEYARNHGISVETLVVLDRPCNATRKVFENLDQSQLIETDFGDQGKVRNFAANHCQGDYIAFLDGDDLWSENWLSEAYNLLNSESELAIAHPEFNWFFQGVSSVIANIDQEDPNFAMDFLRHGNYWDAMCMAPRQTHLDQPYCERRVTDGFAFEDWHWNCETVTSGYKHKVVENTIHFKRRRPNSQTHEASGNQCLMPETKLTDFEWISHAELIE